MNTTHPGKTPIGNNQIRAFILALAALAALMCGLVSVTAQTLVHLGRW